MPKVSISGQFDFQSCPTGHCIFIYENEPHKANAEDRHQKDNEEKSGEGKENIYTDWSSGIEEIDDSKLYFAPESGNVIFASAYHGWGFSVDFFAKTYSKKVT